MGAVWKVRHSAVALICIKLVSLFNKLQFKLILAMSWQNLFMSQANNKFADQPRSLNSCIDSIIPILLYVKSHDSC